MEDLHSLDHARKQQSANKIISSSLAKHEPNKINGEDNKRSQDLFTNDLIYARDTPRDMAEYIFWTGDEQDVTATINDFVTQGLVSTHILETQYLQE